MKTSLVVALLFSTPLWIAAQTGGAGNQTSEPPEDTPFSISRRDANDNIWQRTTYEQLPSGEFIPHTHSFQEVATGLNFKNPDTGEWEASSEEIEIVQGGAVAKRGQHKIIFAADLATFGAIDMETPDGQRLQSHMLGLCYFDQASGQSVFIAEVTNSIGQLISSNEVWYDNAFTGVKAGVRYTYKRDGFEQDVILEEQPPTPESFGLNSSTTVLQAYTEFISPPQPVVSMSFITEGNSQQLLDKTLSFSTMKIGRGRAFLAANSSESTPVAKDWVTVEGRQFLIEQVPLSQISDQLQTLPAPQASVRFSNSVVNVVSTKRLQPGTPFAKTGTKQMKMASLPFRTKGFVLDYTSLNTSQTNYVFQGDTTYYISGSVNLYGTNTTFEGQTVIKYAANVSLTVNTPITWGGDVYKPVMMLAKDDNTIGEIISGSSGNPGNNYYATAALNFNGTTALTNLNIRNLRILNAQAGVILNGQTGHVLNDLQLIKCANGVVATNADFSIRNGLFAMVLTNFTGTSATGHVEQLTSDAALWLNNNIGTNLFLTNCLLTAVTNLGNCATQNVTALSSSAGVFQTVGAGSYYLATNSPYRDCGTTNISSSLLASFKQKTTYPPTAYTSITISTNVEFGPWVTRDTDIPDLGYHYDALDYFFGYVTANGNITFDAGARVGWFEAYNNSYGIQLGNHVTNTFNGTLASPCVFAKYSTVQEGGNGNWTSRGYFGITTVGNGTYVAQINAGFTRCYGIPYDANFFRDSSAQLTVQANNCEFFSGSMLGYWMGFNLTNCLFDRMSWLGTSQKSPGVFLRNCTVHGGGIYLTHQTGSLTWPVWIENCAFDSTGVAMDDHSSGSTNITYCAYNAFLNGAHLLAITNIHDLVISNFSWQAGPLGNWYQSPSSSLINTGSVTADIVGLYHFTTQTNQVKETNSVVDIGYHYVALNSSGSPIDTDGDGLPDYLEDANGDGIYDSGDPFDWKSPDANGSGESAANFSNGTSLLILEPKPTSQIP